MKFLERRQFLYDPAVFKRSDTATALKIHHEYVVKCSGTPYPKFFEVDRRAGSVDPLWHQPVAPQTQFLRTLDIPAIVQFEKLNWNLIRLGRVAQQRLKFWVSNLALQAVDYFPLAGDFIYWSGYRTEVVSVDLEPNGFWQQTNVWLGLVLSAELTPEGDLKPAVNPADQSKLEQLNVVDTQTKTLIPGTLPSDPVPPKK